MRLLVIMNPSAHDFEAQQRWPQLEPLLRAAANVTLVMTDPDNAVTMARVQAAVMSGPDRVLAIGGDGTVHLVVNGMMKAGLPALPQLAVIPFGTANNVAKCLRLPMDNLEAMTRLAVGDKLTGLDLGELIMSGPAGRHQHTWLNCVSVGIDADIVAARARYRKLGSYLSYAAALAERTLEQRSLDAQVEVDGHKRAVRVFNAIIMNVPLYAGALEMPGSHMDDGLLDLYLFDRNEYASKVVSFAIKHADVLQVGVGDLLEEITQNQRTSHGRRLSLKFAFPHAVQVDGEGFGEADTLEMRVAAQVQAACG